MAISYFYGLLEHLFVNNGRFTQFGVLEVIQCNIGRVNIERQLHCTEFKDNSSSLNE